VHCRKKATIIGPQGSNVRLPGANLLIFESDDQIRKWVSTQPTSVGGVFLTRLALRALPVLGRTPDLRRSAAKGVHLRTRLLAVFRGLSAAWTVGAFHRSEDLLLAGRLSLTLVRRTSSIGMVAETIMYAAESAVAFVVALEGEKLGRFETNAIASAIYAAPDKEANFAICSRDADQLMQAAPEEVARSELWPNSPTWWLDDRAKFERALLHVSENWDIWTNWYADRADGLLFNEQVEVDRVLLPAEDVWNQHPRRANELIRHALVPPEDKFQHLNRDEVATVGVRAALRVLPLILEVPPPAEELLLLLRSLALAWLFVRFRHREPVEDFNPTIPLFGSILAALSPARTGSGSPAAVRNLNRSIGSFRSAWDQADGAAAGAVFGLAASDDVRDLETGTLSTQLAGIPLWPGGNPPEWASRRWDDLRSRLISLGSGWEVWVQWYEARIAGVETPESYELLYVKAPKEMWGEPPRVNIWILNELTRFSAEAHVDPSPEIQSKDIPTIPSSVPAAIDPEWRNDRLHLPQSNISSDLKARGLTAAFRSLREQLNALADGIADEVNIDRRFAALVREIAERIPTRKARQEAVFRLGHDLTLFRGYTSTVESEWPSILATRYQAVALHFDQTLRQVPLWREFTRNAAKDSISTEQRKNALPAAREMTTAMRIEEALEVFAPELPQALEQLAESLDRVASDDWQTVIESGNDLLAYDVLESVNNILKGAFRALLWTKIPATLGEAAHKFNDAARKSVVHESERLGKGVGPALTKWGKRAFVVGVPAYLGHPLLPWLAANYPHQFSWLTPLLELLR
jgi:hypothetical protein